MPSRHGGVGRGDDMYRTGRYHDGVGYAAGIPSHRYEDNSIVSGSSGGSCREEFRGAPMAYSSQGRADHYRARDNYSPPRERGFASADSDPRRDIYSHQNYYAREDFHDQRRDAMRYHSSHHGGERDDVYHHHHNQHHQHHQHHPPPPSHNERIAAMPMSRNDPGRNPRGYDDYSNYSNNSRVQSNAMSSAPRRESMKAPPGPPKKIAPEMTIEIFPGTFMRLRGAEETMRAVERDFIMPCECFTCSETIFCIQDAEYVLCPSCRVVSPMEGAGEFTTGGVGLGLTLMDLARRQEDVVQSNIRREREARKAAM